MVGKQTCKGFYGSTDVMMQISKNISLYLIFKFPEALS